MHRVFRKISLAVSAGAAVGLAGCVQLAPVPAEAAPGEVGAARMQRSLSDPDLIAYLRAQLDRDPRGTDGGWTFEALCWVAFYERPDLAVARAQWAAAVAESHGAAERPNPTVILTPGYNSNPGGQSPWFPSIDFDIPLTRHDQRQAEAGRAAANAEARRQEVAAAAWQVRAALWQALVEWSAAQRRVEATQAAVAVDEELDTLWNQRVRAGAAAAGEDGPARAHLALVRSRAEAVAATQAVTIARQAVAAALGLPTAALADAKLPDLLASAEPPRAVNRDAQRTAALHERADVRVALAEYAAAQAELEREVARQYPNLHLGPGYQWDQGASKWSLAVSVEWPVISRNRAAIDAAAARRQVAAARVDQVQAEVLAGIEHADAALAAATARQSVAVDTLSAERDVTQRTEARWRAGEADRLEWLIARRDEVAGLAAQIDAAAAVALAQGEWAAALQSPRMHDDQLIAIQTKEDGAR